MESTRGVGGAKGYRDSGGTLQSGGAFVTMAYDGRGRRIAKTVNTGTYLDCAYHYYLDGDSVVEVRNGSNQVLKQQVRGLKYVDELVHVRVNPDPANNPEMPYDGNGQPTGIDYWVCQDANYNVLGLLNYNSIVKERYEYTPYGQRLVFFVASA